MRYDLKEREKRHDRAVRDVVYNCREMLTKQLRRRRVTAEMARLLVSIGGLTKSADDVKEFKVLGPVYKALGDATPVCACVPELEDLLPEPFTAGQAPVPEGKLLALYPSQEHPGQVVRLVATPDGRFRDIACKPGRAYRLVAKLANKTPTDAEVARFAEAFSADYADTTFFLSDPGDRARLIYAYRPWPALAHSCMAGEDTTPSLELRDGGGRYSCLLEDHLNNVDELRVAMLHTATGEVRARCLVRRVYSDRDRNGEYIGEFIDRRYAVTDAVGNALVEQIKHAVNNVIGVRENGGAGCTASTWEFTDIKACDPYIKLEPNCEDDAIAAYQDTFKYYEDERAYYREGRDRRKIEYEMRWGEASLHCERCGRELDEDEVVTGPDGQIWCDYDCAHNSGWVACSRCGDWVERDEAIVAGNDFFCSDYCGERSGCVRCAACGDWGLAGDMITRDGTCYYCDEDCVEKAGFTRCAECGEWYNVNADGAVTIDGTEYCSADCARCSEARTAETEAQNEANEESGVAA